MLTFIMIDGKAMSLFLEGTFNHVRSFQTAKQPPEATLRGHEYFYFDMTQSGGEPIVSSADEVSLYFKTRQPNGVLFYTGNQSADGKRPQRKTTKWRFQIGSSCDKPDIFFEIFFHAQVTARITWR